MTNLTERNYGRQHHAIINAKYALSASEINLVLTLLTAITKEDKDFKDYEFTKADLELKTNRQWDTKQLKDTVLSLMSKPLTFQEEDGSWEVVNWFSNFKYDVGGHITCRFDKRLKPFLLDLKGRYVISDIRHLLPMKSSYSKRMYLLLKEYAKFGVRTFNLEELQEILKVPKSHKERYNKFKTDVLLKTEVDLNKFSDLKVKLSEKKRGRKVVEVSFQIKKNDEDLKTFISMIRELYVNIPRFITKEQITVKCDKGGRLYDTDNQRAFDKETSQK